MRHPASTYRLQIRESFDLDAAAGVCGYLRDLGVDWVYLSPLLSATSGSDHGYDVVDPTRVDPARGGAAGLARFADAARAVGLGILIDIVPNHMGISDPAQNAWWWDVLRLGRDSTHARAFDIDWEFGGGAVVVPVLGDDVEAVLAAGEIEIDPASAPGAPDGLARYYEHALPLAPGTAPDAATRDADAVREVLARQNFRLLYWQQEATALNYRRFFAVTSLAAVRVEDPEVFAATHTEILRWVHEGLADGLRVDHPDGLADPGGYLDRLAAATGGVPVWVEKILEHAATSHPEALPGWWATVGTTGYDAMAEIDRVLTDPSGEHPLSTLDAVLRAESGLSPFTSWSDLIHETKRMIADSIQRAEVNRLVRCLRVETSASSSPEEDALAGASDEVIADALAEVLACFPVYRAYVPAGMQWMQAAGAEASARRLDLAEPIAALLPVLADTSRDVARRFPQTTGPVMAKGVEDTAFYRYTRLGSLTEVGADPSVFALPVAGFHDALARRQAQWPDTLTAGSTHDTKRGENVRSRLAVLAEEPESWARTLGELRAIASTGHGPFDALLWQAIVGAWPAAPARLHAYAEKAAREAAEATTWWHPDAGFEDRMHAVVDAAFGPALELVEQTVARIAPHGWTNGLSAKLLQLAGPGVPDVYQGSELWEDSLVDPDNRRPVDFAGRARALAAIDAGFPTALPVGAGGEAKLLVTSRVLRLRRAHPELFSRYLPVEIAGAAAAHAIAFDRGGAIAVATRLPAGLAARGGWGDAVAMVPTGEWVDLFTDTRHPGGPVPLAALLATYPVALLIRTDQ